MRRRQALLSFLALACGGQGCGGHAELPPAIPETTLALDPLENLAPAAGLEWVLVLQPQKLTEVLPALQILVPEERFAAFASRHGGVDPRRAEEILIAGYAKTTLILARMAIDPKAVEKSFAERAIHVEGRAADHPDVIRTWGDIGTTREQLLLFGRRGVGLELGAAGPIRAAQLFAEGRLKKASPIFHSPPLDLASAALGPAPVRLFVPGPFSGDASAGMGGLLKVSSAVGVAANVSKLTISVRVAVLEAQGTDPSAALSRLGATFDALAQSGLGKLCALDRPKKGPSTKTSENALFLEIELDSAAVATGLRDATQASIVEILKL